MRYVFAISWTGTRQSIALNSVSSPSLPVPHRLDGGDGVGQEIDAFPEFLRASGGCRFDGWKPVSTRRRVMVMSGGSWLLFSV